jgi:hypothetical protein
MRISGILYSLITLSILTLLKLSFALSRLGSSFLARFVTKTHHRASGLITKVLNSYVTN